MPQETRPPTATDDPAAGQSKRASPFKLLALAAVVGVAGFFLVRYLRANWAEIREYDWRFDWAWFAASVALVTTSLFVTAEGWRRILRALGGTVPRFDAWAVWGLGQTVKYIPGMVWLIAVRVALTRRHKVSMGLVALSGAIEIAMLIGTMVIFSALTLPFARGTWPVLDQPLVGDIPVRGVGFLIAGLCLIALHPRIFKPGLQLMLRLVRAGTDNVTFSSRHALGMVGWYLVVWTINGLGMAWFCQAAITEIGPADWIALTSAYIISFTAGTLVVFLPMGLGVQEAAFAALAGSMFPSPAVAVVVCLATRLVLGASEFLLILIAGSLRLTAQSRNT